MSTNNEDHIYDVIIIGAGYAGLAAALRLTDSNMKNICIVEGQYRIGGRVWSEKVKLSNGDSIYWDAGAAFVGPHQNRLLWLADRYNVESYKVYCQGKNVTKYNNEILKYSGLIPKKYTFDHLLSLLDTNHVISKIDSLCEKIDLNNILNSKFSEKELISMNNISLTDYVYSITSNKKAAEQCITAISANMCLNIYENPISLLSFLRDIKAGGGLMHSLENDGGSQDSRFKQRGTFTICQKIENEIKNKTGNKQVIQFGKIVNSIKMISQNDNNNNNNNNNNNSNNIIEISGIKDRNEKFTMKGRYVIATMPPNLYNTLSFSPNISDIRQEYSKYMKMGCVIKVSLFYRQPFWRDMGYTGLIFNATTDPILIDNELFVASYDDCRPNEKLYPACLACYIVSNQAIKESRKHSKNDQNIRKTKLMNIYKKIFENNNEAIDGVIGYAEKIWDNNYYPLIGGGFGPVLTMKKDNNKPSGINEVKLIDQGSALSENSFNDQLYFASSENSKRFCGYIDGAIESGDECAYDITKKLSKFDSNIKVFPFIEWMENAPPNSNVKIQDINLSWIERNCLPNARQFKYGLAASLMGITAFAANKIKSKL